MDFRDYFLTELNVPARDAFALKAHTSRNLLTQVAYRHKEVELGFADVLVALSEGNVSLDGIPLTARAKLQRRIREAAAGITAAAVPAVRTEGAPRKADRPPSATRSTARAPASR